ncbi:MAG: ATP-binding cassette domain-containing protein [Anaerolineaceae bacterium]|nr:ATP-binding cassette domain-containing protein [Anaerolineaceae bacterium]
MDSSPLVELRGVSVRRGSEMLLDGIDWIIQPGSQWVVTGPNGSGKTLLMQVLLGKVPAARPGEVHFGDAQLSAQVAHVSFEQAQRILAREQELDLARSFSGSDDEGTTVGQYLGATDSGLPDWFGLHVLLNSPLSALSNGEMRKVLLARALASHPRFLILDEPFDGLDSAARATLAELIRQAAEAGTQIVLVTHHTDEIAAPFTHLLRLEAGRVAFCGERSDDVMRQGDELTADPLPTRTALPGKDSPPVVHTGCALRMASEKSSPGWIGLCGAGSIGPLLDPTGPEKPPCCA